ncbi:hypothetical protein FI667_g12136, partial [Globisporangium splendens]
MSGVASLVSALPHRHNSEKAIHTPQSIAFLLEYEQYKRQQQLEEPGANPNPSESPAIEITILPRLWTDASKPEVTIPLHLECILLSNTVFVARVRHIADHLASAVMIFPSPKCVSTIPIPPNAFSAQYSDKLASSSDPHHHKKTNNRCPDGNDIPVSTKKPPLSGTVLHRNAIHPEPQWKSIPSSKSHKAHPVCIGAHTKICDLRKVEPLQNSSGYGIAYLSDGLQILDAVDEGPACIMETRTADDQRAVHKVKCVPPTPKFQQQYCQPQAVHVSCVLPSAYPFYPSGQIIQDDTFRALNQSVSAEVDAFVENLDSEMAKLEDCQRVALDQLQELVQKLWSDALVDVYGSNYTRLSLPASDIDCVLVSRTIAKQCPSVILETLTDALRNQTWAKEVQFLGCAKIPVLKIVHCVPHSQNDIMLDITCGHSAGHTGLSARDLIYSFQAEMPALRPLVLVLKAHIQRHGKQTCGVEREIEIKLTNLFGMLSGMNNVFTGGISSYSLVLLVIRFLQVRNYIVRYAFND